MLDKTQNKLGRYFYKWRRYHLFSHCV